MLTEYYRIELCCTVGASNKEYHLIIKEELSMKSPNRFELFTRYGGIGKKLKESKEIGGVSLAVAEDALAKIYKEKTSSKKGYIEHLNTKNKTKEIEVSLISPKQITSLEIEGLAINPNVVFQSLGDGLRVSIVVDSKGILVKHKKNKINIITTSLSSALSELPHCILDANFKDGEIIISDIISLNGVDLSDLGFTERWEMLVKMDLPDEFALTPTASGVMRKKELMNESKEFKCLVVVKNKESAYSLITSDWLYCDFKK